MVLKVSGFKSSGDGTFQALLITMEQCQMGEGFFLKQRGKKVNDLLFYQIKTFLVSLAPHDE